MVNIENIQDFHYPNLVNIYLQGIKSGHATFQTSAPTWEEWDNSHLKHSRLLAIENDQVLGWAALTPVSSRCVYGGVAEVSVYIAMEARGKGVGTRLLSALVTASEQNQIWTLQSGIFPENTASVHIHQKCGFRIVGIREKIGKMGAIWRDNLLLERRSTHIGLD
jgi:L-amino acid N-acyltransferase YncA